MTGGRVGVQKGPKWGDIISEQPLERKTQSWAQRAPAVQPKASRRADIFLVFIKSRSFQFIKEKVEQTVTKWFVGKNSQSCLIHFVTLSDFNETNTFSDKISK